MDAVLKKWGNSVAIRLPAHVVKESHLKLNQGVEIIAEAGRIVITPRLKPTRYRLSGLLAGINENNRHDAVDSEPAVGREVL